MKTKNISIGRIILHIVLIIGSFLMIFPFLWTFGSSLKNMTQIFAIPPVWIPNPVVWQNYIDSLNAMPFGRAYWNSFYITRSEERRVGKECRSRTFMYY